MRLVCVLTLTLFASVTWADGPTDNSTEKVRPVPPPGNAIPAVDQAEIEHGLAELQTVIKAIGSHELLPDVLVYEKAVRWALEYKEILDSKGAKPGANVKKALKEGLERAKALKAGKTPWTTQTGSVVRGYRSKIDNSVQPYWLVIPKDYDFQGSSKHRLDFWWHGRGETLSEANFLSGSPGTGGGIVPAPGALILHPYGRYCNANKLAGEIDTLECLEHARKHYRIDDSRLVARGFSMGGAACWQYGAHYPTLWAACAPGAGFCETPEFLNVFQKEKLEPTWYEKKLWHLYNASDTAKNFFNLPTVAYSGEIDSQKQAADVMAREMKKVGLELTHIIGPKTGHSYEPKARAIVNEKIDVFVTKGKPQADQRNEFRFETFTLRYNQCDPITVLGLGHHWQKATISGAKAADKVSIQTTNITAFSLDSSWAMNGKAEVTIEGEVLKSLTTNPQSKVITFQKVDGKWQNREVKLAVQKQHGLQGPIDDAFLDSFVMVKPTGSAMNEKIGKWTQAEMTHAVQEWRHHFRGDAIVKDDKDITAEDIAKNNLILWGDPKSNAILAKIADKLPLKEFGDSTTTICIYPNPLNPKKYVVLNSGFTFREYDYLNNARQVPKLPDYAVVDVSTPPNSRYPGKILRAGFFDEQWKLQANDGKGSE